MPIVYRKLRQDEAGLYRRIYLASLHEFPDNFGSMYQDQVQVQKLPFEVFIESGSTDNFVLGAFDDRDLIGITGFRRGDRPKTMHWGEVVQVYVDPAHHGKRIGETLVRELIASAFAVPGIDSLELSAVADNSSAQKLYEKIGFETYGIRSGYFKWDGKFWDQRFMQLSREIFE